MRRNACGLGALQSREFKSPEPVFLRTPTSIKAAQPGRVEGGQGGGWQW